MRYRADGASRKFTLGSFPSLDLKAARRAAEEARGEIAKGEDPAAAKRASRAAAKAEREGDDLVENVVSQFIERYAKTKTRDWRETESVLLKRNVVERWPGKALAR